LKEFRSRFGIPLNDEDCATLPFYRPSEDSIEIQYLRNRRETLGGYTPARSARSTPIEAAHDELFKEFSEGSDGREVSTTMAFVGMLRKMLKDAEIGKLIVPIVPDEARTFGMESLFRTVGIYASGDRVRAGGYEHAATL
jgi:pyruvate dehydrogenase E1 component